jgi:hypothetical protein
MTSFVSGEAAQRQALPASAGVGGPNPQTPNPPLGLVFTRWCRCVRFLSLVLWQYFRGESYWKNKLTLTV